MDKGKSKAPVDESMEEEGDEEDEEEEEEEEEEPEGDGEDEEEEEEVRDASLVFPPSLRSRIPFPALPLPSRQLMCFSFPCARI
jgi:hypothetical protein